MQAFVPESALDVDPDCDPDELELLHALATRARATSASSARLRLPKNRFIATMTLSRKSLFVLAKISC
jgi:hypothetical protein